MPVYVAMLRGINLGPHKRIKMDRLRESFEGLGFEQVKTYIQSGNVVFRAGRASAEALGKKIEDRIVSDFGFSSSNSTALTTKNFMLPFCRKLQQHPH
jgi:uncharacterized protein (DUF1697 family)